MEEQTYRKQVRQQFESLIDLNETLIARIQQLKSYIARAGFEVPNADSGMLAPIVEANAVNLRRSSKRLRTGELSYVSLEQNVENTRENSRENDTQSQWGESSVFNSRNSLSNHTDGSNEAHFDVNNQSIHVQRSRAASGNTGESSHYSSPHSVKEVLTPGRSWADSVSNVSSQTPLKSNYKGDHDGEYADGLGDLRNTGELNDENGSDYESEPTLESVDNFENAASHVEPDHIEERDSVVVEEAEQQEIEEVEYDVEPSHSDLDDNDSAYNRSGINESKITDFEPNNQQEHDFHERLSYSEPPLDDEAEQEEPEESRQEIILEENSEDASEDNREKYYPVESMREDEPLESTKDDIQHEASLENINYSSVHSSEKATENLVDEISAHAIEHVSEDSTNLDQRILNESMQSPASKYTTPSNPVLSNASPDRFHQVVMDIATKSQERTQDRVPTSNQTPPSQHQSPNFQRTIPQTPFNADNNASSIRAPRSITRSFDCIPSFALASTNQESTTKPETQQILRRSIANSVPHEKANNKLQNSDQNLVSSAAQQSPSQDLSYSRSPDNSSRAHSSILQIRPGGYHARKYDLSAIEVPVPASPLKSAPTPNKVLQKKSPSTSPGKPKLVSRLSPRRKRLIAEFRENQEAAKTLFDENANKQVDNILALSPEQAKSAQNETPRISVDDEPHQSKRTPRTNSVKSIPLSSNFNARSANSTPTGPSGASKLAKEASEIKPLSNTPVGTSTPVNSHLGNNGETRKVGDIRYASTRHTASDPRVSTSQSLSVVDVPVTSTPTGHRKVCPANESTNNSIYMSAMSSIGGVREPSSKEQSGTRSPDIDRYDVHSRRDKSKILPVESQNDHRHWKSSIQIQPLSSPKEVKSNETGARPPSADDADVSSLGPTRKASTPSRNTSHNHITPARDISNRSVRFMLPHDGDTTMKLQPERKDTNADNNSGVSTDRQTMFTPLAKPIPLIVPSAKPTNAVPRPSHPIEADKYPESASSRRSSNLAETPFGNAEFKINTNSKRRVNTRNAYHIENFDGSLPDISEVSVNPEDLSVIRGRPKPAK